MGYRVTKIGNDYNYPVQEFFCDTEADIATLPNSKTDQKCFAGSKAIVANGKEYRLNTEDKWVESSSGSGVSLGTTNYEELENLPQIAGIELKGSKTLEDLGIQGSTDDGLATEHKTIVGAINELLLKDVSYTDVDNKPSIGGIELDGNKTLEDL